MTRRVELDHAQDDWRLARDSALYAQINMGMALQSKRSIVDSFQSVAHLSSREAEHEYQVIINQHREELLASLKRLDETGQVLMKLLERDFPD